MGSSEKELGKRKKKKRILNTQQHEPNLAVSVDIGFQDGLVYDLLELNLIEIITNHHLQHLKQLAVGNKPVPIHVINLRDEPKTLIKNTQNYHPLISSP